MDIRRMFGLAAIALFLIPAVSAQQQPPPKQEQPKKAKKVWSDEDIASVRKPSDAYVDQKSADDAAARAQADAQAKAAKNPSVKAAPPKPDPVLPYKWPKSQQEADQWISDKKDEIQGIQDNIEQLKNDIDNAPNDLAKQNAQKNLDEKISQLADAKRNLKALQDYGADLKAKAPAPAPKPEKPQQN